MTRRLSEKEIIAIYKLLYKPGIYGADVAQQFGISPSMVSLIWRQKRHKQLTDKYRKDT